MHASPVTCLHMSPRELLSLDAVEAGWSPTRPLVVVVPADDDWPEAVDPWRRPPDAAVVIGVTQSVSTRPGDHPGSRWCDVIVATGDERIETIVDRLARVPVAASVFVGLLRHSEERSLDDGLALESAAYSMLQGSPEFQRWRVSRPSRPPKVQHHPPVRVERTSDHLVITLDRPHVRNALDTAMRDSLMEAFTLVALDDTIITVTLRGEGASFCSGGDLDEFGSFTDPASAHLVRLEASIGRAIARVAARVTVHLDGDCIGSGIELPCFAERRVSSATARFALPELTFGLIPGAGGTWSLPQRIGRHRTALLGLTGETIDAPTASEWGLATEISAG